MSNFGKGISVGSGFDLGANLPLDNRTIQDTVDDLLAIPEIQLYEGLTVYVKENKTVYIYKGKAEDGVTRIWDIASGVNFGIIESSAVQVDAQNNLILTWTEFN